MLNFLSGFKLSNFKSIILSIQTQYMFTFLKQINLYVDTKEMQLFKPVFKITVILKTSFHGASHMYIIKIMIEYTQVTGHFT